jgi:MFS family permease
MDAVSNMNTNSSETTPSEFRHGWTIVLASFVGVAVGLVALPFYTYGVLAPALQEEFGWSRAASQLPLLFQTIGLLLVLPFVGWAVDRFGPRKIALLSMALYSLVWASFSLMTGPVWQYLAIAFFLGAMGAGTLPITWTRGVNGAFRKRRGLALGLSLMGSGAAGFLAPPYVNYLIAEYGWQSAFLGLALLPAAIGLPLVFVFFRVAKPNQEASTNDEDVGGHTFQEALRDRRFWLIAFAFLFVSFAIGGSIPNLFQIFVGKGFEAGSAAAVLSTLGIAVIVGRLGTGILLDHFWAPRVAAVLVGIPALAAIMLTQPSLELWQAYFATILIGLAAGAEFDVIAYLAVMYFGLRHYSKIYSFLYAAFAVGAAAAPAAFGYSFDTLGSYTMILYLCCGLFILGAVLLLALGGRSADE